jgi:hypothetical protein
LWAHYEKIKEINVVKLGSYPPNRKYMFCCHPHGMIFLGPSTVFAFNMKKYPLLRFLKMQEAEKMQKVFGGAGGVTF